MLRLREAKRGSQAGRIRARARCYLESDSEAGLLPLGNPQGSLIYGEETEFWSSYMAYLAKAKCHFGDNMPADINSSNIASTFFNLSPTGATGYHHLSNLKLNNKKHVRATFCHRRAERGWNWGGYAKKTDRQWGGQDSVSQTQSLNPCRLKERVEEPRIFTTQCSQQLICPPTQCPNSQAPADFLVRQAQTAQN
ncbi:Cadherin-18 [Manis pentadactyla]|nr:Cadherin-18 [Manis pentadactyla]